MVSVSGSRVPNFRNGLKKGLAGQLDNLRHVLYLDPGPGVIDPDVTSHCFTWKPQPIKLLLKIIQMWQQWSKMACMFQENLRCLTSYGTIRGRGKVVKESKFKNKDLLLLLFLVGVDWSIKMDLDLKYYFWGIFSGFPPGVEWCAVRCTLYMTIVHCKQQ